MNTITVPLNIAMVIIIMGYSSLLHACVQPSGDRWDYVVKELKESGSSPSVCSDITLAEYERFCREYSIYCLEDDKKTKRTK